MSAVLSCRNLTVKFGGFTAVSDLTLDFAAGKTTAIIGPNGAGKTTLINMLSGVLQPTSGQVLLASEDITSLRADQRTKKGIGRSFQIVRVFPEMTVRGNLRIAAQKIAYGVQPFWKFAGHDRSIEDRIEDQMEFLGLGAEADVDASSLSHGKQRALELGITLMGQPKILLLDEPLAGVGHSELRWMSDLLETVRHRCTTIIIEHNMDAVVKMADEVVVLVGGKKLVSGAPSEVTSNQEVRRAYLGN
jgi:branched-chain amino acid transport system ATP-binding protein